MPDESFINTLYYGDNLDILRRYIPDESIDLVYLDPPFKSSQNYNILFKEQNGSQAASQIRAFEDTWTWSQEDEAIFADLVTKGGKVADCLQAFRTFLGPCDMLAYLVMMAPRLAELRRAMKPSASIYLHCDPAASHYLKMLMDAIFGPFNFKNEIVWTRTASKSLMTRRLPSNHDIIFCFQKTPEAKWILEEVFQPYNINSLNPKTESKYCHRDPDGRRYQLSDLTNPNPNRPNLTYKFLGFTKVWRWKKERMLAAHEAGLVIQPNPGSIPRYKRYLDEQRGLPLDDVWSDIPPLNSQAKERLGYPTQKPEPLLERIIRLSTEKGDLVLDPFCGCGTTVAAAQKLNRRWIGIDITHLAITLMKTRLNDAFGNQVSYRVVGEPVSIPDAAALAESDPYQFQWWALGLVGARPVEQKKGADKGIDGKIVFQGEMPGEFDQVLISVKAGHITSNHVRDLRGVVDREKAAIGVLISMESPTKPMHTEGVTAGFYESKMWGKNYPKIQLLTIAELLASKKIDMPPIRQVGATFKKAEKFKGAKPEQLSIKEDPN
jgi:site-specific DNA-methyltransferase (adenine-specific)